MLIDQDCKDYCERVMFAAEFSMAVVFSSHPTLHCHTPLLNRSQPTVLFTLSILFTVLFTISMRPGGNNCIIYSLYMTGERGRGEGEGGADNLLNHPLKKGSPGAIQQRVNNTVLFTLRIAPGGEVIYNQLLRKGSPLWYFKALIDDLPEKIPAHHFFPHND